MSNSEDSSQNQNIANNKYKDIQIATGTLRIVDYLDIGMSALEFQSSANGFKTIFALHKNAESCHTLALRIAEYFKFKETRKAEYYKKRVEAQRSYVDHYRGYAASLDTILETQNFSPLCFLKNSQKKD